MSQSGTKDMAGPVRGLRDVLVHLEDDRVTVRKKAQDDLLALLDNRDVLSALNNGSAKAMTWDSIYTCIVRWMKKEYDRLQKENSRLEAKQMTQASPSDLEKKLAAQLQPQRGAVASMLRKIIRKANTGEARLHCSRLVTEIVGILDPQSSSFVRRHFGVDAAIVLQEDILANPSYRQQLQTGDWRKIMEVIFHFFVSPPEGSDLGRSSRLLHEAIQGISEYTCIGLSMLQGRFVFFQDLITSQTTAKSSDETKASILSAANAFLMEVGWERRESACEFGETAMASVLGLYNESSKEILVTFCQIQMGLHHPNGARTQVEGAYFGNESEWQENIRRIYVNVVDTVIANRTRSLRLRNSTKDFDLSQKHLDLSADVCFQLFKRESSVPIDSTQIVAVDSTQMNGHGSASKRRKLEAGLENLVEKVCSSGFEASSNRQAPEESLPWIQILLRLFERHPVVIREHQEKIPTILRSLVKELKSDKHPARRALLLKCCTRLLNSDWEGNHQESEWSSLFELCCNLLVSNQCVEEANELIQQLLSLGCVKAAGSLYTLFVRRRITRDENSLKTLLALLRLTPVPKIADSSDFDSRSSSASVDLTCSELLRWIWTSSEEDDERRKADWLKLQAECPQLVIEAVASVCSTRSLSKPSPRSQASSCSSEESLLLQRELLSLSPRSPPQSSREQKTPFSPFGAVTRESALSLACEMITQQSVLAAQSLKRSHRSSDSEDPDRGIEQLSLALQWLSHFLKLGAKDLRLLSSTKDLLKAVFVRLEKGLEGRESEIPASLNRLTAVLETEGAQPGVLSLFETGGFPDAFWARLLQAASFPGRRKEDVRSDNVDDFDHHDGAGSAADRFNVSVAALRLATAICCPKTATRGQLEMLDSFQDQLVKLAEDLLAADRQDAAIAGLVLELCNRLCCIRPITPSSGHRVMRLLTRVPAAFIGKAKFHVDGVSQLLDTLVDAFPLVRESDDDVDRRNFVDFMAKMVKFHADSDFQRFPYSVQCKLVRLISVSAQHPHHWLTWKGKWHNICCSGDSDHLLVSEEESKPVGDALLRFVEHPAYSVRCVALEGVSVCMANAEKSSTWERKRESLKSLHTCLERLLVVGASPRGQEMANDGKGRIATALLALATVAVDCPSLEREAVTGVVMMLRKRSLPPLLLDRVLDFLSGHRGASTTAAYLESLLGFALYEFLKLFPMEEFPLKAFDCTSTEDFLARHESVVVPLSLWRDPQASCLKALAKALRKSERSLLASNYLMIVSYYLPVFLASSVESKERSLLLSYFGTNKERVILKTKSIHDLMTSCLGKEEHHRLMNRKLPEILSQILLQIHDPDSLKKSFGLEVCIAPPNPPYTSEALAMNFVDYWGQTAGQSLFRSLSDSSPDFLQRICLRLCSALRRKPAEIDARLRALHGLYVLLRCISKETRALAADLPFVAWFVTGALLVLIREHGLDGDVGRLACNVLQTLLELAVKDVGVVIPRIIVPVRNTLVEQVMTQTPISDLCHKTLEWLIDRAPRDVVSKFGAFPKHESFAGLQRKLSASRGERLALRVSIENFLEACEQVPTVHRMESLQALRESLALQKSELSELITELRSSRGFCEEAEASLLHKLIFQLMAMASAGPQSRPDVAAEAGRCLGEVGPCDLGSHCLRPSNVKTVSAEGTSFGEFVPRLVHQLLGFLTSEDNATVEAASAALRAVLNTAEGRAAVAAERLTNGDALLTQPFCAGAKPSVPSTPLSDGAALDNAELWLDARSSHEAWVVRLAAALLGACSGASTDLVFARMIPICRRQSAFAETIVPMLVHDILDRSDGQAGEIRDVLSRQFRNFFEKVYLENKDLASKGPPQLAKEKNVPAFKNPRSVRIMLHVVEYLRSQNPKKATTVWQRNLWLSGLSYLHVASAALFSSAYFSAVTYADIWCQGLQLKCSADDDLSCSLLDRVYSSNKSEGGVCQRILYEAYERLGEDDALYGCGSGLLLSPIGRIKCLVQEQRWLEALACCDAQIAHSAADSQHSHIQQIRMSVLERAGLQHLLGVLSRSDAALEAEQSACAFRLGQWEDAPKVAAREASYARHHLDAVSALFIKRDGSLFGEAATKALDSVLSSLSLGSTESCRAIYRDLGRLRELCELERLQTQLDGGRDAEPALVRSFLTYLGDHDKVALAGFEVREPIVMQRCLLLKGLDRLLRDDEARRLASEAYVDASMKYIQLCRESRRLHLAQPRAEALALSLQENGGALSHRLQLEEAVLAWNLGEKMRARALLQDLRRSENMDQRLLGTTLQYLGNWSSESRTESDTFILENYLEKAVECFETGSCSSDVVDAYKTMAKFCDAKYKQIAIYLKSKQFEEKQSILQEIKKECAALSESGRSNQHIDIRRGVVTLTKNASIDERESDNLKRQRDKYLKLALSNYGRAIESADHSEPEERSTFRLVALWFENISTEWIGVLVSGLLQKAPTFRFVPLLNQLCARLGDKEHVVQRSVLRSFVVRCASEHPYHALPILMALVNADDSAFASGAKAASSAASMSQRAKSALSVIEEASQRAPTTLKPLADSFDRLTKALIDLAYKPLKTFDGKKKPSGSESFVISRKEPLANLSGLQHVPILTLSLPVRPRGDYGESIVGIKSFRPEFETVGGINAPKKIHCLGTDGKWRPQLLKGQDDLRQDAVMQQVFSLMNSLLHRDSAASKRRMTMRTYRVVPLSQRSGILEWCENTLPLKDFLIGANCKTGAHARYFPKDMTAVEARKKLQDAQTTTEESLKAFKEICTRFHPVLRFFFYESFPTTDQHFERRLTYTRTVAVSSMVGYVLGLGDRHVQNILIDKTTAELVHIDLGIAFEQGKILPKPETIPFRLTRDIVDGFGPCGVEGTFRRCCEMTMRILRESKDEIMTILEVLVFDPLYNWSLTPEKAFRIQFGHDPPARSAKAAKKSSEAESNKMAERVLMRVAQKLDGVEEGQLMSLEGQVNALIQQARDPARLCQLFVGWQAYI